MCTRNPQPTKTDEKCPACGGAIWHVPAEHLSGPRDLFDRHECEDCLLIVRDELPPADQLRAVLDARMMAEV